MVVRKHRYKISGYVYTAYLFQNKLFWKKYSEIAYFKIAYLNYREASKLVQDRLPYCVCVASI